jgi:hypothetical protein
MSKEKHTRGAYPQRWPVDACARTYVSPRVRVFLLLFFSLLLAGIAYSTAWTSVATGNRKASDVLAVLFNGNKVTHMCSRALHHNARMPGVHFASMVVWCIAPCLKENTHAAPTRNAGFPTRARARRLASRSCLPLLFFFLLLAGIAYSTAWTSVATGNRKASDVLAVLFNGNKVTHMCSRALHHNVRMPGVHFASMVVWCIAPCPPCTTT